MSAHGLGIDTRRRVELRPRYRWRWAIKRQHGNGYGCVDKHRPMFADCQRRSGILNAPPRHVRQCQRDTDLRIPEFRDMRVQARQGSLPCVGCSRYYYIHGSCLICPILLDSRRSQHHRLRRLKIGLLSDLPRFAGFESLPLTP
ncbi:hypothetical protein [Chromatium okenii]|uniref:Uncharacterized protein n=1 Tax=Chromatium okenii TaxID=61644 RepID=A0A2S7XSU3_9GAMM|nr:hypothetical protein [Chromatium okenii]PQJ96814.1 hypothetical protein CXB77_05575 [Chromatium okenii]